MPRILLPVFLILFGFGLKANHQLTALVDYRVDTTGRVIFRIHHYIESLGSFPTNAGSLSLAGPVSVQLPYDLSLSKIIYLDSCGASVYDLVYESNPIDLSNTAPGPQGYYEFTFQGLAVALNNTTNLFASLSLRIYPSLDPFTGDWIVHPAGTISSLKHPWLHLQKPGQRNYLPIGVYSPGPMVDSVITEPSNFPNNHPFNSGYNLFTPLPDSTEDPNSGANLYSYQLPGWSYEVFDNPNSSQTGKYACPVELDYYSGGQIYASQSSWGHLFLLDTTAAASPPLIGLEHNQNYIPITGNNYVDTFDLSVGDSIELEISSLLISGDSTRWTIIRNDFNPGIRPFNQNPALIPGQLISLNTGGGLSSGTPNQLKFTWKPQAANYSFGPREGRLLLRTEAQDCYLEGSSTINLLIRLNPANGIYSNNFLAIDSLKLCGNQSQKIRLAYTSNPQKSVYWSPAQNIVAADTLNNFHPDVQASQSGWLYLRDSLNGQKLDSIYILVHDPAQSHIRLQNSNGFINLIDSTNFETRWFANGLAAIPDASQDHLNIRGSATYWTELDPGINCLYHSDTLRVLPNDVWGSNLHPMQWQSLNQHNSQALYTDSLYRLDFTISEGRSLRELTIWGLHPDLTNSGQMNVWLYENSQIVWQDSLQVVGTMALVFQDSVRLEAGKDYSLILQKTGRLNFDMKWSSLSNWDVQVLSFKNKRKQSAAGSAGWSASKRFFGFGMKFDSNIGMEEWASIEKLQVYPNPSKGKVIVVGDDRLKEKALQIFDMQGRLLLQQRSGSKEVQLQLEDWEPGLYRIVWGTATEALLIQ